MHIKISITVMNQWKVFQQFFFWHSVFECSFDIEFIENENFVSMLITLQTVNILF